MEAPDRFFHLFPPFAVILGRFAFLVKDVHKYAVHPAPRTELVEEADPFQPSGFPLRFHAFRHRFGQIACDERTVAVGAGTVHRQASIDVDNRE